MLRRSGGYDDDDDDDDDNRERGVADENKSSKDEFEICNF